MRRQRRYIEQMTKVRESFFYAMLCAFLVTGNAGKAQVPGTSSSEAMHEVLAEVGVAPNPTHGDFHLKISTFAESREIQIEIVNLLGSVIQTRIATKEEYEGSRLIALNISSPGIYFVRVNLANKVFSKKVVVN